MAERVDLDAARVALRDLRNYAENESVSDLDPQVDALEGLIDEVARLRSERIVLRVHHAPSVVTWATLREVIAAAQGTVMADTRGAFFDANREAQPSRVEVRVVVIPTGGVS